MQFEMQQQPQLVLLQKTMAVSEGVGRVLNPNLNIWQLAQPLVEGWIRANLGPEARAPQSSPTGWRCCSACRRWSRASSGLTIELERAEAPAHGRSRDSGTPGVGSLPRRHSRRVCC